MTLEAVRKGVAGSTDADAIAALAALIVRGGLAFVSDDVHPDLALWLARAFAYSTQTGHAVMCFGVWLGPCKIPVQSKAGGGGFLYFVSPSDVYTHAP